MDASQELTAPLPSPEEEWQFLVAALRTRDPVQRLGVARALSAAGAPVVPLLVAELEGAEPEHQEAILSTLGMMGRTACSARSAVEKLVDSAHAGQAARDTLQKISAGPAIDRDRLLDLAIPTALILLVVLTIVVELGKWLELWAQLGIAGRGIALVWGGLGGLAGFFYGSQLGSRWLAWKAAHAVAAAGACGGAVLGRLVAAMLAPLLTALGG